VKLVTINLQDPLVKGLDYLVKLGLYPSRSEAIRNAIMEFVNTKLPLAKAFKENNLVNSQIVEEPVIPQIKQSEKRKKLVFTNSYNF